MFAKNTLVLDQPDLLNTDLIRIIAELFGNKEAVVCGEERLSLHEFHYRTNQVANLLLNCLSMANS
jgi:hypothetical protein